MSCNIPTIPKEILCKEYENESQLNFDLFDHFGAVTWMRLWRNNVGAAKIKDFFVKFGVVGSGDIQGILNYTPNHGRFISWESKIEGHKYDKAHMKRQADYRVMIENMGGIAIQGFQVSDMYAILASVGIPDNVLQSVYDNWKGRQR